MSVANVTELIVFSMQNWCPAWRDKLRQIANVTECIVFSIDFGNVLDAKMGGSLLPAAISPLRAWGRLVVNSQECCFDDVGARISQDSPAFAAFWLCKSRENPLKIHRICNETQLKITNVRCNANPCVNYRSWFWMHSGLFLSDFVTHLLKL